LRYLHTDFCSGYANLCSHQQCIMAPFPHILTNICCCMFSEWLPLCLGWNGISMWYDFLWTFPCVFIGHLCFFWELSAHLLTFNWIVCSFIVSICGDLYIFWLLIFIWWIVAKDYLTFHSVVSWSWKLFPLLCRSFIIL
jgi:hypothetical protein